MPLFTSQAAAVLQRLARPYWSVHIVTDTNVAASVLPRLHLPADWGAITVAAGEANKSLDSLARIWHGLSEQGATRGSLVINLGGGMVSDLGGFAAATYQRGITAVNVPTSLLAMVDASVGGKTAIDFDGVKNMVGTFTETAQVVVDPSMLATLPRLELLSGYGEMMKHSLLQGFTPTPARALEQVQALSQGTERARELLRENIAVKERLVASDPHDHGVRQALNLGHTAGHALEMAHSMPHGVAVAYGLLAEMVLSHITLGFPSEELYVMAETLRSLYMPVFPLAIDCKEYDGLLSVMGHDKKNRQQGRPTFTLLSAPGRPALAMTPDTDQIKTALDITRDLLGV